MNTLEIKKRLIDTINSSSNKDLLEEIYNYLNVENSAEDYYILSENQNKIINKGREQIKNMQSLPNEVVNVQIERWLSEK